MKMSANVSDRDWVVIVAKAILPRGARRWIRKRRFLKPFGQGLRPTDVFLVGHPKSGNTWLAYMLAILLTCDRHHRVTLENVGAYIPFVHGHDQRILRYHHLPNPRIFRNECPVYPHLYPKTIYLVRDPRAVLVSFYHMYRVMFDDSHITLESFVNQYLSMNGCFAWWNQGLVRWDRQVQTWFQQAAHDKTVLIMKYEELVLEGKAALKRLVDFLEIDSSEEDITMAWERGNFEAMQKVEEQYGAEAYKGRAAGEGKFVRMGKIDGWKKEMDEDLALKIEKEFGPSMKLVGYLP